MNPEKTFPQCYWCDEPSATTYDGEECCYICEEEFSGKAPRPEIPHKHSDNDAWRRFGEQVASLDDDEAASIEAEMYREDY